MDLLPTRATRKLFVVSDPNCSKFFKIFNTTSTPPVGLQLYRVSLAPGEKAKSLKTYGVLISRLLALGIDRNSLIVAVGGGVVANVTGFAAATLFRGLPLIQIPTTLLCQLDAAVDFKHAINGPSGKNQIGSYHPPTLVIIDPTVLRMLPVRHLRNGLAEAIKHALVQSKGLYKHLTTYQGRVTSPDFLEHVVLSTVRLKCQLLRNASADASDMCFQYGHAIAHAIEHASRYDLLHGEALSIGMCISSELAYSSRVCNRSVVAAHYDLARRFNLPTRLPRGLAIDTVLEALRNDKNYSNGYVRMSLLRSIGTLYSENGTHALSIDIDTIRSAFLNNCGC